MIRNIFSYIATTLRKGLPATLVSAACIASAHAAPVEKYASSSVLSQGNWVKIDIKIPGLQTLSAQTLRNFGFSDPSKVNVYGYGGRMISEILSPSLPDDLPQTATVRGTDGSITFYAVGNISVESRSGSNSYTHTINPYSETSYYFLSDRPIANETSTENENGTESRVLDLSDIEGLAIENTFKSFLVHERDLLQCADSGRDYLGEDFRSTKSQTFKFDLTDNVDGNANIKIKFGTSTSGALSSILVSANGERLKATNNDNIPALTSSSQYYTTTTTTKVATNVGNSLTVGIDYTQGGVVTTARLDWIEVDYTRHLKLNDSQLQFSVNPKIATAYSISGASERTIIWDVTDPADIKIVKGAYNATDKTITIGLRDSGLREFIAFEPDVKGASVPGKVKVANQDIHAMPTPDMVIITPDALASAAERIANLHRQHDNMTVYVLSPDKIYNEFSSGNPDVSAFRKLLKMWYDRSSDDPESNFRYCLLMGRPTYDQKRKNPETQKAGYPTTLIWQSTGGLSETTSYCTDDFIGMLEDETTSRSMQSRAINVGIGRYPVTNLNDANIVIDKLESYMTTSDYGIWRNNIMVIADDGDSAQHLVQANNAITSMLKNASGSNYAYERVYLDAFELKETGTGNEFPDAKERMLKKWEKEGVVFINYIGHANPKEWGHEKLLTWEDINSMSNQHLPILYAATCSFGKWDAESISGAEIMLNNPAGGAIAVITPSRTVYISQNGYITEPFSEQLTKRDLEGKGQRLGDILRLGKNNTSSKYDNMNRFHLFGDPALRMPLPQYFISVDSIDNKVAATELADAPTLKARSQVKVSGKILDNDGNTVDFNGPLLYVLFDAERSVTTHGWGETGKVETYQDQSSKLATGSTTAKNGLWSATILMPSEIANNYSPALLTLYAYDTNLKTEASGSTNKLYVYGHDYSADDDFDGPTIEKFLINSENFTNGELVHSSPVAIASFHDESGINISDAGIGHKMSLILDGTKVFDDLGDYYTPDTETEGRGSIAYPLANLTPGEHSLMLTVWDNANNSSSAEINFNVGINMKPDFSEFYAIYDQENDLLTLRATTDRLLTKLNCEFECFSLNGDLLWSTQRNTYTGKENSISYQWDLTDSNGRRLPRGIYIMRAKIGIDESLHTTKSKKIAIPAK